MFANAKKVSRTATPAAGKPVKAVDLVPGWAEVCALDACAKALKGALEIRKAQVSEEIQKRLIARGIAHKKKPDTMHLAEGQASGSAYLRKRDTRSPLSQDEIELIAALTELGVDEEGLIPGFTEMVEVQPTLLAVNPEIAKDQDLLRKIDKAIKPLVDKGVIPDGLIVEIEGERKTVVSDDALDRVFSFPQGTVEQVLPVISGVTMRPVFKDMDEAWSLVRPLLATVAEAAA